MQELLVLGGGLGEDGGGGAGAGRTQADYEAQTRLESQLAQQAAERQYQQQIEIERQRREFEAEQARLRAEEERKRQVEQILAQRQESYLSQAAVDPVKAILLGRGFGQEAGQFNARLGGLSAGVLPELAGVRERETDVEGALARILGYGVDINEQGVSGLGSAEQSARQFQMGDESGQTLLRSAFGVGGQGFGGGLSADEYLRRIQEVTPTGSLR
jgi:hypothetical protein